MAKHDKQYLDLVHRILTTGFYKTDRTGTGTTSISSAQMRFDLTDGSIPLLTTKKMFSRGMIHEILWYFRGMTNIQYLLDNNVHIWDDWADQNGELGPVYGAMWRAWPDTQIIKPEHQQSYHDRGYETLFMRSDIFPVVHKKIDQLGDAIKTLRTNPDSRRIIINSWNPALLPVDLENPSANPALGLQALPPCHCMFQFTVLNGKLNCDLRQRSADIGLGVPFNIAQYSIITHIVAKMVGLQPGEFVWNGVDVHAYSNHIEPLTMHLGRGMLDYPESPTVKISDRVVGLTLDDIEFNDIEIVGYTTPYPKTLSMKVAV